MTAGDAAGDYGGEHGAEQPGIRERLSSQAEDTIGKLADDLLENPIINSALQTAFSAREKMAQAQETAMEALNLPSASNVDKLARRLRSISQRLDEIEDGVERVDRRLEGVARGGAPACPSSRSDSSGSIIGSTTSLATSQRSAASSRPAMRCRQRRRAPSSRRARQSQRRVDDAGAQGESGVPDTVRRAVERTFQSTLGSGGLTRDRAQELVDDVLRHAEAGAARAGRGVREAGQTTARSGVGVGERVRERVHGASPADRRGRRTSRPRSIG